MDNIDARRDFLVAGAAALAVAQLLPTFGDEASVEPLRIGLGFSLYGMKSLPLDTALAACGKIGYDCVELSLMPGYHADPGKLTKDDRTKLRELLATNKLRACALMENLVLLADEKQHQVNLERLKMACEFAAELSRTLPESRRAGRGRSLQSDKPLIETVLGGKPADWEATREKMAERLAAWAKVAGEHETVVTIKGHVGNAAHLPEHVVWLVKQVESKWLKAAYDLSHFELRGLKLEPTLKTLLPHTAFIHVKDARGVPEKFQFLLPGEGTIDYAAYFKLLGELGYQGDIVVEVSGQISSRPDYDPLAAARRSYESLAPFLGKAGLRRK